MVWVLFQFLPWVATFLGSYPHPNTVDSTSLLPPDWGIYRGRKHLDLPRMFSVSHDGRSGFVTHRYLQWQWDYLSSVQPDAAVFQGEVVGVLGPVFSHLRNFSFKLVFLFCFFIVTQTDVCWDFRSDKLNSSGNEVDILIII